MAPAPVNTVKLEGAPRNDWVKNGAAVALLLLVFGALAWAFVFEIDTDTEGRIAAAFWGILPLVVIAWYTARTLAYLRGGSIAFTPSGIVIRQPTLFGGQLEVGSSSIRRFDLERAGEWSALGLLRSRSPLPSLDQVEGREPNGVLLFDPPVPAPKRLRRKRERDPLPGEHMQGALVRFADANAAEEAAISVGIEVEAIEGEDIRRARERAEGKDDSTSRREALARRSFDVGALSFLGGIFLPFLLVASLGVGIAQITEYDKKAHGLVLAVPSSLLLLAWLL